MSKITLIRDGIEASIRPVLAKKFPESERFKLEIPAHKVHGDYAANYGFAMKKQLGNPIQTAEDVCAHLNKAKALNKNYTFEAIKGFVNLTISDAALWNCLRDTKASLKNQIPFAQTKKRILLEYVSANPTGPLHIGHGRWAVLGDVLSRVLHFTGNDVSRAFYINDSGNQINLFYESVKAVREQKAIPEGGYHGYYIKDLVDPKIDPLTVILDHQKQVLQRLQVEFDSWFSEKTLHESGAVAQAIEFLKEQKLTYERDGATWFHSSALGDDKDRVLIKSDGAYTYFAVDIAYHRHKIQEGHDQLVNIWGADHHGYVKRVSAAVAAMSGHTDADIAGYFKVVIGQLVSLFRDGKAVRMSKRSGDIITLEEVIDEIGVDATRFFLLQKSADTHLDFDLDLAKKQSSENPVYYIQYAHARICSILRKMSVDVYFSPRALSESFDLAPDYAVELEPAERQLVLHLIRVYDEISDAASDFQTHQLCVYSLALAKLFHVFYENCPVLKASKEDQLKRVRLLKITKDVFALSLGLMGISVPESM